ncbi:MULTISPECIES: 3-hydroxyacyl-CoA dehydrogenase NAD-binding domain-containing protein [unclassified Peribacillus]|uniref:3-hydroxyacyl-CoA dehydrogenase NAD-binding domain-containing protein n=1 Tax=unclassified Peribacillus TaxID=2675266 RepID=UPI0033B9A51A
MICAMRGYSVVVYDINDENLKKTKESLQHHMDGRIRKGGLIDEEVNDVCWQNDFFFIV